MNEYYREGLKAYENKMSVDMNPYEVGTEEHYQWEQGWYDAAYNDDFVEYYTDEFEEEPEI